MLQRDSECSRPEACSVLESVSAAAAGKPLCCPNHEGKVGNPRPRFVKLTPKKKKKSLFVVSELRWKMSLPFWTHCLPLQVMEFYCESCETAMCLDCTEGEHREHVTVPLRDVVEQHKAVLKTQLDAIRGR